MNDYRILRDGELEVTFRDEEVSLLKRLLDEFQMWPGRGETPNGTTLSEAEDSVLWNIISKITEA